MEADRKPVLRKWLVRVIWLGSIAFFQALEFQRYLDGRPYRPFFALYTGVICAAVVWFATKAYADMAASRQRRRAELRARNPD
jgi:hypothetical protein